MRVRFETKIHEASDIYSFTFSPRENYTHTAGQFIEINLKHDNPDKRGSKRWFTLSSAPGEDTLSFTTRIPEESSSFKNALAKLSPKTELSISQPEGDFVLPDDKSTPLIFVAGGIGVTPFRSMVKRLALSNDKRKIQLVYASRSENDLVFLDIFKNYGVQVHPMIDTKINAKNIFDTTKPSKNSIMYISGPEPMVETLHKECMAQPVKLQQIKSDFFPGYSGI